MHNSINKPNGTGIKRIFKAAKCSIDGFTIAFKLESAFRQELLLCVILAPISFFIAVNILHWFILIGTLFILLMIELINSAIEIACDAITMEQNTLIKYSKDIASTAVFLALWFLGIIWATSLYNHFVPFFKL